MPRTRVVKAKGKRRQRQAEIASLMDVRAQRKLERAAENQLIDLEERAQARYDWALALKKQQSEELQRAVNRMTAVMARMAGPLKFTYEGATINVDGGERRLRTLQYHNHLWIAMRLFVAAAEWGIRIGDFRAPKGKCIRCGKAIR